MDIRPKAASEAGLSDSDLANLAQRLENGLILESNTGCHLWCRGATTAGYGVIRLGDRAVYTHRLAYRLATGEPIPKGLLIRHACNNPLCCNPKHLRLGTAADNVADMVTAGHARGARGKAYPPKEIATWQAMATFGGMTVAEIARRVGAAYETVRTVIRGKRRQAAIDAHWDEEVWDVPSVFPLEVHEQALEPTLHAGPVAKAST